MKAPTFSGFDAGPTCQSSATVSECGRYRYDLRRSWDDGPHVTFLMINPSTADADDDDPTITRCIGFARSWGFSGLYAVNLYALRATNVREVWKAADPVGPLNDAAIQSHALLGPLVAAWGAKPKAKARAAKVLADLARLDVTVHVLRLTKGGYPEHPLCLPGNLKPTPWEISP